MYPGKNASFYYEKIITKLLFTLIWSSIALHAAAFFASSVGSILDDDDESERKMERKEVIGDKFRLV